MTKLFNPQYQRWEVLPDNPRVVNGEEMAMFVSPDEEACDAYMMRFDKAAQCQTILRLIERNGYIDRVMAARNGVMELAARICEMQKDGIVFTKTWIKRYDREGKYLGKHMEYGICRQ